MTVIVREGTILGVKPYVSMTRLPRIHYPGAVYHVMARGVDGREIFLDDGDRNKFLKVLCRVKDDSRGNLLAYCLMGNHFHLALKIEGVPLSALMHRLLTSYSLSFNKKHNRTGHLFQARYKAVHCDESAYLVALIRYIHLNPVRAGLTTSPELWPWSSYGDYRHQGRDGIIDNEFDLPDLDAPPPTKFEPWPSSGEGLPAILTRTQLVDQPSIEELADTCLYGTDITRHTLRSKTRRRAVTRVKNFLIQRAIRNGHTLTAVADWLGICPSSVRHYLHEK